MPSTLKNDAKRIDAVVLDYRLPDSNDLTLLTTVRRLSPGSAVVLMTAFGTPELVKGALEPDGSWIGMDTRPIAARNFLSYTLTRLGVDHIDIYRPGRLEGW